MNSLYKWLVFNSLSLFVTAYGVVYHDGLNWMINNDPTRISLIITGIYVYASVYIVLGIFSKKETVPVIKHIAHSVMGLGLIGTILATYWFFKDAKATTDTKQMIMVVFNGIGTAQITTLFGLGIAWVLDQQRAFVLGVKDD